MQLRVVVTTIHQAVFEQDAHRFSRVDYAVVVMRSHAGIDFIEHLAGHAERLQDLPAEARPASTVTQQGMHGMKQRPTPVVEEHRAAILLVRSWIVSPDELHASHSTKGRAWLLRVIWRPFVIERIDTRQQRLECTPVLVGRALERRHRRAIARRTAGFVALIHIERSNVRRAVVSSSLRLHKRTSLKYTCLANYVCSAVSIIIL